MRNISSEEFYKTLKESEPGQEYLAMVSKIKQESRGPKIKDDGYEAHHIHPVALGGDFQGELIKLTCFEHCVCHFLLLKAIPCYETLQPIVHFSERRVQNISEAERITLEEVYGWSQLREKAAHQPKSKTHCKNISKAKQGHEVSEKTREKLSASVGDLWKDPEYRKKQSKSHTGSVKSEESKEKRRRTLQRCKELGIGFYSEEAHQNRIRGNREAAKRKNYRLSEEVRQRMSESHKGKHPKPESIQKMLETKRRNGTLKCSEETKQKISEARKGHLVSEETRQKLVNTHLGHKRTEESRAKQRETWRKKRESYLLSN